MANTIVDYAPIELPALLPPIASQYPLLQKPLAIRDTIAPAGAIQGAPFKPSRPELYSTSIYRTLHNLEKLHAIGSNMQTRQITDIDKLQSEVQDLNKQNAEKIRESAIRAQGSGFWSYLQTIGTYIITAFNTIFGCSLYSSGNTTAGALLIGAGVLSLANEAMTHWGAWDWLAEQLAGDNEELARFLSLALPGACALIAAGLTFGGLSEALGAWNNLDSAEQLLLIMQVALSLGKGVTTVGKGISDYRVQQSKIDLTNIECALTLNEKELEMLTFEMEKIMKMVSNSTECAQKIIQLAIYSNHTATAQV